MQPVTVGCGWGKEVGLTVMVISAVACKSLSLLGGIDKLTLA